MTENDWTESISNRLKPFLKKYGLDAKTLQRIPYAEEINGYAIDWNVNADCITTTEFQTDLVIFEQSEEKIIPRVIIEAKLGSITTHDAITYSYKAEKHKTITPFLRYGIMIGKREEHPLPGRLFRHGTNFDFMFSFVEVEPTRKEWNSFIEMLLKEVEYSRIMEEMLHENRNKDRKRYYMLQKQLVLKEVGD